MGLPSFLKRCPPPRFPNNEIRIPDYMSRQPELTVAIRKRVISMLVGIQNKFGLAHDSLYLSFSIIDRFFAAETIAFSELLLVGVTAMYIASKFIEPFYPTPKQFLKLIEGPHEPRDIEVMETRILNRLDWKLNVCTPAMYLFLYIYAAEDPPDPTMMNMVCMYAEMGMSCYPIREFSAQLVAAAATYAARATLGKSPLWHNTLELEIGFKEHELIKCSKLMVDCHQTAIDSASTIEDAIYQKYSEERRCGVALYPPPKSLFKKRKVRCWCRRRAACQISPVVSTN